jgi:hypothetical protein
VAIIRILESEIFGMIDAPFAEFHPLNERSAAPFRNETGTRAI